MEVLSVCDEYLALNNELLVLTGCMHMFCVVSLGLKDYRSEVSLRERASLLCCRKIGI